MILSIFDIAKGISWTNEGRLYLDLKHDRYELLIDYLNSASIESLKNDINRLDTFQVIRNTKTNRKLRII